jgi:GntR family transcriptional regulator, transcriptional repressor for pyruvate dehydrogenase complex
LRSDPLTLERQQVPAPSDGLSLTDNVAEKLSRHIAESRMAPGEPLPSEDRLSQAFLVSKRVIREALRTLSAQGIVKTSQGKRAVVADPQPIALEAYFKFMRRLDARAIVELYELREIVEVRAAALAAQRATSKDIEAARKAVDSMEEAGDDAEKYVAGDLAFHAALMNAAHNRFLSAIVGALSGGLREERKLGVLNRLKAGDSPDKTLREHRAIIDAVAAKDPILAERRIIEHMKTGRTYIPPADSRDTAGRRRKGRTARRGHA